MQKPEFSPSQAGSWSDKEIRSREEDGFNFQDYADVIANLVLETDTPVMFGIFGEWGIGKTSLMKLIQEELNLRFQRKRNLWDLLRGNRRPVQAKVLRLETIWINVWQLTNQDELWNAFLVALLTGVHSKLPIVRRFAFDLRLLMDRLHLGALVRQLLVNAYRIVVVIVPILVTRLWPGPLPEDPNQLWVRLLNPITGGTASLLLGLWLLVKPAVEAAKQQVSIDLGEMLPEAPFEVQITTLQKLQGTFERMVDYWVGKQGRLVVFIDDLDRCPPDKAPGVLEALKLFTTTRGCVYILGLDYEMLQKGVMRKYIFQQDESEEYLEKIIQVPFHLPPLQQNRIEDFIRDHYVDLIRTCESAPQVFSRGLTPNPRKIKRALNIYRLLLELNRVRVSAWDMDPINPELLAKMVVIQSRFRRLHDRLVDEPILLVNVERASRQGNHSPGKLPQDLFQQLSDLVGDDGSEEKLVQVEDLPALSGLLQSGNVHFEDVCPNEADLLPYIYLTRVEQDTSVLPRPSRQEREGLLSNDMQFIRETVDQIQERVQAQSESDKERIFQSYVQRLEETIRRGERTTEDQRRSANRALAVFSISRSEQETVALKRAIDRDAKDPELHYLLGIEFSQSNPEEALNEFHIAVQLDQKNQNYRDAYQEQSQRIKQRDAELKAAQEIEQKPGIRPLTPIEIAEAQRVFDQAIDYPRVRVVENARWVLTLSNIGGRLQGRPLDSNLQLSLILGNRCYFSTQLEITQADPDSRDFYKMEWLVHALTFVWQYQRKGWRYLLEAVGTRLRQGAQAYDYGAGYISSGDALREMMSRGFRLADFNILQQAEIARSYYSRLKTGKDVSAWQPYIEEFRIPEPHNSPHLLR